MPVEVMYVRLLKKLVCRTLRAAGSCVRTNADGPAAEGDCTDRRPNDFSRQEAAQRTRLAIIL